LSWMKWQGDMFFSNYLCFPYQYHPTNAPHKFTDLSPKTPKERNSRFFT
jgi:hypothetical protein